MAAGSASGVRGACNPLLRTHHKKQAACSASNGVRRRSRPESLGEYDDAGRAEPRLQFRSDPAIEFAYALDYLLGNRKVPVAAVGKYAHDRAFEDEIGRASCRERGGSREVEM